MAVKDADIARLLSPVLAGEPDEAAARLLAEPDGVHRAELPGGERVWVVSRYDDVRLRKLVVSAFTARRADSLDGGIQASCDALIDAFPRDGAADLLGVYAAPLPVAVICDLLGVPGPDGAALRECTQVLLTPAKFGPADVAAAMGRIVGLLGGLIAAKRAEPTGSGAAGSDDGAPADLLSAMIAARDGADRLSEDELLSLAFLVLFAGYENSVHLITAATARLLTEPDRAALVRTASSPHTPEMRQLVEEFLRDDPPATNAFRRFPTEDVEVGETIIPAGDIVYLAIGAANRDPGAGGVGADAHLTFGHGPHYCLGAPLARLETRIALWTLFHRVPDLALAVPPEDLPWKSDHRQHVLRALPVTYSASAIQVIDTLRTAQPAIQ